MESEVSFTLASLPCGSGSIVSSEYNRAMDEQDFRRRADASLESLKRSLYEAEGEADFEVEENAGALHIAFEEPPGRFVISPNAPVRQIWISALSTSFKLDWSEQSNDFALSKTGETIKQLVGRLINEQLGEQAIRLN
jgi:iron-sulfur cluster assembly protein CyaY